MKANAKKLHTAGRVQVYRSAFVLGSLLVTMQAIGAPRKFG